jgi:chromosomal replication initiation ATPase DnaA
MGTLMAVLDALDRHSLAHKRPLTLPLTRAALKSLEP